MVFSCVFQDIRTSQQTVQCFSPNLDLINDLSIPQLEILMCGNTMILFSLQRHPEKRGVLLVVLLSDPPFSTAVLGRPMVQDSREQAHLQDVWVGSTNGAPRRCKID